MIDNTLRMVSITNHYNLFNAAVNDQLELTLEKWILNERAFYFFFYHFVYLKVNLCLK